MWDSGKKKKIHEKIKNRKPPHSPKLGRFTTSIKLQNLSGNERTTFSIISELKVESI